MSEPLRRCDACATPIFSERILCPQCGCDLDEPDAPLAWPLFPTQLAPHLKPVAKRPFRWVTVILVLLGMLAAAVLIRWFVAGSQEDPLVMPAAQRDQAEETVRVISQIGTLKPGDDAKGARAAQAMVDGDSSTAWFGEAPALGFVAREQLLLRLDEPAWVTRLVIANGVHATLNAYDAHGRMRTVELAFEGGITHTAALLDIGRITQQIELPSPTLTTSLKITVLSVYPGQEQRDVAVTAIDVHGYEATVAQQRLATQRALDLPAVDAAQQR